MTKLNQAVMLQSDELLDNTLNDTPALPLVALPLMENETSTMTFASLGIPAAILTALEKLNYTAPTPIQQQAIPYGLQGKDILGSAQTGTGKTAAFGIPLIARLMENSKSSAMVITPTRELAAQVEQSINDLLGKNSSIKTALLIGGEPMPRQTKQLRARPRIIVGTPGRINDHIERGTVMLVHTDFLVLDETDRMLDMGFSQQIDRIVKFLPKNRQTLLFSATLPQNIMRLAESYLQHPVRVSVESKTVVTTNIDQVVLHIAEKDKYDQLVKELEVREGSVIVFVKTKWNARKMAEKLHKQGFSADAIHGDLSQNARTRVIKSFRDYKFRVLVATDIAARGLDIPHIEHVVNYNLPQSPEDYIHRIGRTARAGAMGSAICFLTPTDKQQWREISKLLDPSATPEAFPAGEGGERKSSSSNRRRKGSGRVSSSAQSNSGGGQGRRRDASAGNAERSPKDRPSRNAGERSSQVGRSAAKGKYSSGKPSAKSSGGKSGDKTDSTGGKSHFNKRRTGGTGGKKIAGKNLNIVKS